MLPKNRTSVFDVFGLKGLIFLIEIPSVRFLVRTIVAIAALAYFVALCWVFVELFAALLHGAIGNKGEAIRNIGLLLVAMLGAPFVAWRAMSASVQAQAAEQGYLTDRITKGVEQLAAMRLPAAEVNDGSSSTGPITPDPSIDIRIGGIYTLERVSKESKDDHIVIMEILSAYVRGRVPLGAPRPSSDDSYSYAPARDVSVALLVLGRRGSDRVDYEISSSFRLNLSAIQLQQYDLEKANFSNAWFSATEFTNTFLAEADLSFTWLYKAKFDKAVMRKCSLRGAALPGADLREAIELDKDELKLAYGVRAEGKYQTLLPDGMNCPDEWDWFEPSSPNLSFEDFFKQFDEKYIEHCVKVSV